MADIKIVREWLQKADEDFNFARANLDTGEDFYAQICFHFHQAAEKYLKAYIIANDLRFEKMHNLISLLRICSEHDSGLLSLMDYCEILNTAYIDTRYPVFWPTDYNRDKAVQLGEAANAVSVKIKGKLVNSKL
jgi:HEPN domain-containing protein